MKKLESLKKLKEIISSPDVKLAQGTYLDAENCNCVIAHLLKLNGVTDDQLRKIEKENYYNGWYSISSIITESRVYEIEDDFVKESLEALGFDLKEDEEILGILQSSNDSCSKKEVVIKTIEKIIAQLEGEIN